MQREMIYLKMDTPFWIIWQWQKMGFEIAFILNFKGVN